MDRERIRHIVAPFLGGIFLVTLLGLVPPKLMELNQRWGFSTFQNLFLQAVGVLLMLVGGAIFVSCSSVFKRIGRGTPVPTDPPIHLVSSGLYRFSRNPIYLGYVLFLLGEFFFLGHFLLLCYAILTFVGAHVAVILLEEPPLRRKFGREYLDYTKRVSRWISLQSLSRR